MIQQTSQTKSPHDFSSLHQEALLISKNLHRQEFLMIEVLQRIDEKKVYLFLGFKSLFQYATIALKLSKDRAYAFILVSRKASKLSKMQEALKNGELGLSKAKRISSVITKENEEHWLELAKTSSQRSLERLIAKVSPKSSVEEGMRFVSESVFEFKAAIEVNTGDLIKRVQDVLSQSTGRAVSYDEALKAMAKEYLKAKDPVVKAQRVLSQKIRTHAKVETSNKAHALLVRKPIPSDLKHQVYLRDRGMCQQKSEDAICGDARWIDIHHIVPVSQGGENILENLITLCKGHHQMEHAWTGDRH